MRRPDVEPIAKTGEIVYVRARVRSVAYANACQLLPIDSDLEHVGGPIVVQSSTIHAPPPPPRGGVLSFSVQGDVVPRPPFKARIIKGGRNGQPFAKVYQPDTDHEWRKRIRWATEWAMKETAHERFECDLSCSLRFEIPRPKSHHVASDKSRPVKLTAPSAASLPDVDNLAKPALDAITDAGAWRDDALVVDLSIRKAWVAGDVGHCHVTIREI